MPSGGPSENCTHLRKRSDETSDMWRARARLFANARRQLCGEAERLARRLPVGRVALCVSAGASAGLVAASGAGFAAAEPSKPPQRLTPTNTNKRDIDDDYEFGKQLGTGAYGRVYYGKCKKTGRAVAIKAVPKRKENEQTVRAEVAALRRVALCADPIWPSAAARPLTRSRGAGTAPSLRSTTSTRRRRASTS